VVDDERGTAEGLALALRYRGFPVRLAGTADQAMALMRSQRPRVLLSDVMMPEKSGIDLIAALRADEQQVPRGAPVHAIAMSGRGSPADRRRLLRAGFDDYLQKPIDIDGLVARIDGAVTPAMAGPPASVRILVAAADPALARRVQEALLRDGRDVVVVNSAAQARARAREGFPDVLVVGLQLPDGSGARLARELLEDRQSLWVIGVGRGDGDAAQVFDLLLDEPLDPQALEQGLRSMRQF
jgi:DNA-binding response OmpR family regulator